MAARITKNAKTIEDKLAKLAAEVPEGDWVTLPADLTQHLDHYLYGMPKRADKDAGEKHDN